RDSRIHGAVLYGAGLGPIRGRSARGHATRHAAQFRHGESVLLGRVQSLGTLNMSQSMRKIVSIVMPVAVAATMGCHADGITKPQTAASPEAHGLIVSTPMLLSLASTSAGAATASQDSLAFVSLIPGTAPGGVSARIRNRATRMARIVPVIEGGFDPVGIAA